MHLPQHQEMLRNAGKYGGIAAVEKIIREENSAALHIENGERETLSRRRFVYAPLPARRLPHKSSQCPEFLPEAHEAMRQEAIASWKKVQRTGGTSAASKSSENTNEARELAADAV